MANIAIYDVITKQVKQYLKSVNTPEYSSRADVVVNPVMPPGPLKFLKEYNGQVVEMTQAERDAVTQAEAQAVIDAEDQRVQGMDDLIDTDHSSVTLTRIDATIDNIGNLADAKLFFKKLCRYIIKHTAR